MRTVKELWVPLIALLAVLGSGAWLVTQDEDDGRGFGPWGGMGRPMMGGPAESGWRAGDRDPVDDLAEARDRAADFAKELGPGLRVGEVMRFANNYYAELEEADGAKATEVLINPSTGAVQLEFGPAMMWNTDLSFMPCSRPSESTPGEG